MKKFPSNKRGVPKELLPEDLIIQDYQRRGVLRVLSCPPGIRLTGKDNLFHFMNNKMTKSENSKSYRLIISLISDLKFRRIISVKLPAVMA